MQRRDIIKASALAAAWPVAARAQPAQVRRIGVLTLGNIESDIFRNDLREELVKAGYVEGRNVLVDARSAQGRPELLPTLAAELVAAKVDVIVALLTPSARAAQQATRDVPIVVMTANAVETGIIASLVRPGGNITGVSMMAAEAHGKCVEVLSDMLPSVRKVAALGNASDPFMPLFLEHVNLSAKAAGVEIVEAPVRGTDQIEAALAGVVKDGAGAVVMQGSLPGRIVADLALKQRLPSASFSRAFPDAGGLLSYGANSSDMYRRSAYFVIKILRGAKPADIPAEQPTKFDLVINLRTAKALGINVPPTLLARADDVIE
jgi:putative ABC transport system substrate-binding protein